MGVDKKMGRRERSEEAEGKRGSYTWQREGRVDPSKMTSWI